MGSVVKILSQAVAAVQRNLRALAIYLVIAVGVSAAGTACNHLVRADPSQNPYGDPFLLTYELVFQVVLVVSAAVAQTISFARMAAEIERPLWKISGDREALGRFFMLWFVLNGCVALLFELAMWASYASEQGQPGSLLFLLYGFAFTVYIPIGVAVMFTGRVAWRQLGNDLGPLLRQFPWFLLVLGINLFLFFFYFGLFVQTEAQPWLHPAITAISVYFDCVIFAAVWLICRYDRDNPQETDLDL